MPNPRDQTIKHLLEIATDYYFNISDIHHKLLKLGYNKPFTVFLKELQARVTYKKLLE